MGRILTLKFFILKKGRIERLLLTTLDLWEGRGRRQVVFYIKSVEVHLSTSGSTTIDNDCRRGRNLCLLFFKKVWSFIPSDLRSGIRSLSSIRPICKCRCPPLRLWLSLVRFRFKSRAGTQGLFSATAMRKNRDVLRKCNIYFQWGFITIYIKNY